MKKKISFKNILYKKKRVIGACMVIALGIGTIAVSTNQQQIPLHDGEILVDSINVTEEQNVPPQGSLEEKKATLELERNKLLSSLEEGEEKTRVTKYMEQEISCQQIIASENLPDTLVIITENSVNVTVDMENLDTVTVAKICDIVMRETGKTADKIIIQSLY